MEDSQSILFILTIIVMIGALFVSIIPYISGALLMWALALVFGLLTSFSLLPLPVMGVLTALMIAGATTEYWMPLLGARVPGMSCLGAVGSLVGGIVGTFMIPIPILGTIIGMIAGAMLIEFTRLRDLSRAVRAGRVALQVYLWGIVVEFGVSLVMMLIFIGTVLLNSR